MGCLSGKVTRVSKGLQGRARRVGAKLMAAVSDVTERLQGRVFLVCSMADLKYLNVSPEDIVWITPDQGVVYNVESNTTWRVIYDL